MTLSDLKDRSSSSASLEETSGEVPGEGPGFVADQPSTEVSSSEEGNGTRSHSSPAASSIGMDSDPNRSSVSVETWGVQEIVTPTGIEIYYQAGKKRLYRINGTQGPSMSDILSILDKPGLPWWGMKIGIEGVVTLLNEGEMILGDTVDVIVDKLTKNKLTVNHVRDRAGDRGMAVHDALEVWANTGRLAPPNVFNPEERGYVQALNDFLTDCGAEPLMAEVMVASAKLGYAGRFDLSAQVPQGAEVVVKTYPVKKPIRQRIGGGKWMFDLKTSKDVYDSHFLQLEGYELAYRESYDDEHYRRGVIHVTQDGRYELVESRATIADFLAIQAAHRAMKRIKERKA